MPPSLAPPYTLATFGTIETHEPVLLLDVDGTLISTKSGRVFPVSIDDWQWIPGVLEKLTEWSRSMRLVFITNQKKLSPADLLRKASQWHESLQRPFYLVSGHADAYYRKPYTGLWQVLSQHYQITKEDVTRMIGDMETDCWFAFNVGIPFTWAQTEFGRGIEPTLGPHPLTSYFTVAEPPTSSLRANKHLVVMMGAPASGKSTLAKWYEEQGYVRLNRDTMTPHTMSKAFDAALLLHTNVVLDNTNATVAHRLTWIHPAKVRGYHVTVVWIDLPKPVVMHFNAYRLEMDASATMVPDVAIHSYFAKRETPTAAEGYDELVHHTRVILYDASMEALLVSKRF